ncbi:glycosyltransferase family 87 protein [Microvirga arsenatis]|uniref:DUF2029 domain-containing protein n=1 Tax=Microvirga arsenatis TaxID=2692265 RepID=A0ABW9YWW8_9HYPH|nr:glycosyltransferase family 87 protein [Microvirga arsenatis]NBJ10911.1 DUF2029 domain-containing protein [Microvirga arsenatis]NBJ24191.1 DUF2029 domain-containing protein [Microvirga arsenatis]
MRLAAAARWISGIALVVLSILAIRAGLPRMADGGLWDFGSFVESGRAARAGSNPYGVYPLTLHVQLPGFESWNPNLNPPISALIFQLFDVADPRAVLRVWRWISILFYGAAVLLLLRRFQGPQAPVIAVWAFALAGFWDTLLLGQIYLPLVFATVLAWLLLEREESLWAGVLIGFVVAIKPNFLVWPALLFLSGHRPVALAAAGTAAVISAVPLAVYGPEIYHQWLELVVSDRERAFFLTNASFAGLAARAGVPALGIFLGLGLLAGLAAWAYWRRPNVVSVSGMALLAALLASPLGWVHYTLFLLPVLLTHWHRPAIRVVALLLIIPVPFVIDQFTKTTWIQFTIGSVYAWALVLCLADLIAVEWRQNRQDETENEASGRSSLLSRIRKSPPAA